MAGEKWHHLQLIDKLESHRICSLCEKSVLGSRGYKCGECSFLLHESCPETTDHLISMKEVIEARHDLSDRHHLISMKEVEKNGDEKKVVVCSLCDEPVSSNLLMLGNNDNINNNGPTFYYKCCFPNCTFLIHQPCAQLPNTMPKHPLHISHDSLYLRSPRDLERILPSYLYLILPRDPRHISRYRYFLRLRGENQNHCGACLKACSKHFYYECDNCKYMLDIKCASRWRASVDIKCNEHAFIPTPDPIEFTCQVCGVKSSEIAYLCSNYRLLIHFDCGKFPATIKIRGHGHSLTCTFSLSQVKMHKCKVCYKNVHTKYAAYCCDDQKCDYIAHLRCAYWFRGVGETSDSVDYFTHLVEGNDLKDDEKATSQEIEHSSHPQHKLILKNEELLDVKSCAGCMQFIVLPPFYGCVQCNYSLHIRCTKLPQKVMRTLHHDHPLTLHNVDSKVKSFECWACWRTRSGFSYKCVECSNTTVFDAQCILIPEVFQHKGHQHRLFLGKHDQPECNACGRRPGNAQTFNCTTCGFRLCIKCATLPLVTKHRYDTHLLYLTYVAKDDIEEYYCQICEKEMDEKLWFYYCENCDFAVHPQCILGRTCFN